MITTTEFGKSIILTALGYAKGWAEQHCTENDVDCYKYLFENDYSKVLYNDWCAFLATGIVRTASEPFGFTPPIPFTGASHNVVTYALKNGIRVDQTPAIGSLFWYSRDGSSTLGHTGVIVWMDKIGLITVEGNSGDTLKCFGCPKNAVAIIGSQSARSYKVMSKKPNICYVHLEEYYNTPPVTIGSVFVSEGQQSEKVLSAGMGGFEIFLLLSLIGGGFYAALKR